MVTHLDTEDQLFKSNKDTFRAIDVDYSGLISTQELKQTLIERVPNYQRSDEMVQQIMDSMDYD
jgi:Ca2+-binding EF-hand superfamily protein